MRLLIATSNPDKITEIRDVLQGLAVRIDTLADLGGLPPPDESGATFAENARAKALYYADATGRLAVAEDSGLEIELLDGAPGVESARFNGPSYAEKFEAIYRRLDARGGEQSPARFVCAVAMAHEGRIVFEASGSVKGLIVRPPRGRGGFGYDPIFLYPPYGRTLAEVSREAKAAVSHRGQAFRQLRAYLAGELKT